MSNLTASLMRPTGESTSTHNMFQLFKQDGVTPVVGGVFIVAKEGMKYASQGPLPGLERVETSFLPQWKPNYDVNDPNAGWVSYNSTRRGGFRSRKFIEHS